MTNEKRNCGSARNCFPLIADETSCCKMIICRMWDVECGMSIGRSGREVGISVERGDFCHNAGIPRAGR
eukprot:scaffold2192_cov268-Chaetoceros_neogracile.AAC.56